LLVGPFLVHTSANCVKGQFVVPFSGAVRDAGVFQWSPPPQTRIMLPLASFLAFPPWSDFFKALFPVPSPRHPLLPMDDSFVFSPSRGPHLSSQKGIFFCEEIVSTAWRRIAASNPSSALLHSFYLVPSLVLEGAV